MNGESLPRNRLHPVVDALANSDGEILDVVRGAEEPILKAIAMLRRRRLEDGTLSNTEAIAAAERISSEDQDPELYSYFLILWACVSMQAGRLDEAGALLARARGLASPGTPPEMIVFLMETEGVLAGHRGDKARREDISSRCLDVLPRESPRYPTMIISHAIFLAQLGRESEIDARLDGIRGERAKSHIVVPRIIQAVETGRLDEAVRLAREHHSYLSGEDDPKSLFLRRAQDYLLLMRLMLGRWAASPAPDMELAIPTEVWALPIDHLLLGKPGDALEAARAEIAQAPAVAVAGIGPNSYNLVRAELANGHGEAARLIMEQRLAAGNRRYLDDIFLARIELMAGNEEAAARHFAALLDACDRYRARGRLDFELRMARELSPGDLAGLAAAAGRLRGGRRGANLVAGRPAAPESQPSIGLGRMVGGSRAARDVAALVLKFAPLDAPVLIAGETGTGKELIARAIHEEGPRGGHPFVAVNCGAIAESLLESELFGHERGAFTGASRARRGLFEEAGKGSILLDEIGEISPRLQVALLRVLDAGAIRPLGGNRERRIVCRMLAATNADLDDLARRGLFREDLLFRLRRLEIVVPPLRERPDDIILLAGHFLAEGRHDGRRPVLSEDLQKELCRAEWKGNVRELRNAVERMRLLNSDKLFYDVHDWPRPQPANEPSVEASGRTPRAAAGGAARPPGPSGPPEGQRGPMRDEETIRSFLEGRNSSLRRLDRLRELFARHRQMNRKEVATIMGVARGTATRDLQELCRQGVLEKVEPGKSPRTHYFRCRQSPAGE